MNVTSLAAHRKKMASRFQDSNVLQSLGRKFGLSIILPATPDNMDLIKAGPGCLGRAADYYAIAENRDEKDFVVMEFHEGVRQHARTGLMELNRIFEELEKQRA